MRKDNSKMYLSGHYSKRDIDMINKHMESALYCQSPGKYNSKPQQISAPHPSSNGYHSKWHKIRAGRNMEHRECWLTTHAHVNVRICDGKQHGVPQMENRMITWPRNMDLPKAKEISEAKSYLASHFYSSTLHDSKNINQTKWPSVDKLRRKCGVYAQQGTLHPQKRNECYQKLSVRSELKYTLVVFLWWISIQPICFSLFKHSAEIACNIQYLTWARLRTHCRLM